MSVTAAGRTAYRCPTRDTGLDWMPAGTGPCFEFHLKGVPVLNAGSPDAASISFGTLFVRIASKAPSLES
jgi:hypothetical protein